MRKMVHSWRNVVTRLPLALHGIPLSVRKYLKEKPPTAYCVLTCGLLMLGCSESREQAVPVTADFEIEVVNNDFSVPVQVKVTNRTEGADIYQWTFTGATPESSTDKNPGTIVYTEPGEHTIALEASNQDGSMDTKTVTLPVDAEVVIGFDTDILIDSFPPMEVAVTNTTVGADTYDWTFEGGTPASSTDRHPGNIVFNDPGGHTITLEVGNGLETHQTQQTVTVAPHLVADFDHEVAFEDDDFQAPVTLTLINNSVSATGYTWTFAGGTPGASIDEDPTVTFEMPGTYMLELEATNGKETLTTERSITVLPNTNIRVFNDIQLGINTAHTGNVVGAFFSTVTREVYKREDVKMDNGAFIDIAFFGLNENFNFNKFVSPDEVQSFVFDAIPNAGHTKFINLQESCGCTASMTAAQFDAMEDDTLLAELDIVETTGGLQDFEGSVIPRIVLFETEDGRKGAIKIKDFVVDGANSHIVVDIKVQKEPT